MINRLCDPGSEFAVHRSWFMRSAMDELLTTDFAVAEKDRLYRCLDRVLPYKDDLCRFLTEKWKTRFDARFDVLLYDLTSTYFEGSCARVPKAKFGYSREKRPDCRQVVIALIVTTDGLPLAYEVFPGNTLDETTLKSFLEKIAKLYGKARRGWVMDRGIPTEQTLEEMRSEGVAYLVGTPRSLLSKLERDLVDRPWEQVHEGVQVKLLAQENEVYVLARSMDRRKKEAAIQLVDVHIPTTDGRALIMPRYTEPETPQEMILEKLNLRLPKQPPPRIRSGEVMMPTDPPT